MRIVNDRFEAIKESDVDLSKGHLVIATAIREDAEPVDDVTKFAYADDDYEEVQMYVLFEETEEPSKSDDLLAVIDVLLGTGGEYNE